MAIHMKKSGIIYAHIQEKQKLSVNGIKIFFILLIMFFIWTNQTRIAGSKNQQNKSIVARLVRLAVSNTPTPSPTITPSPTPTPTPVFLPSRLIIEKLGIDAQIEFVGADENGKMENPSQWNTVGWYKIGPVPVQHGNSVIAGHLDTNLGKPAVFYNLENLETGDIIQVLKMNQSSVTFQVTGKEIFPYDQVPVDNIFMSDDKSKLILITCNGQYFRNLKSYSHRLAVISELI